MASSKKDAKSGISATKTSSARSSRGSGAKTTAPARASAKTTSKASPSAAKASSTPPVAAKASTAAAKSASSVLKSAASIAKSAASAPKSAASIAKSAASVPKSAESAVKNIAKAPSIPKSKTTIAAASPRAPVARVKPESAIPDATAVKTKTKPSPAIVASAGAVESSVNASAKTAATGKTPAATARDGKTPKDAVAAGAATLVKMKPETSVPGAKACAPQATSPNAAKSAVTAKSGVSKTEHVSGPVAESPIQSPEKSSPVKSTAPVAATPTAIKAPVEGKPAPAVTKPVATAIAKPRPIMSKLGFKLNEYIVYPAHGVGQIISVEIQEVAGFSLELYVVSFIKDKMILKVPTSKVSTVGMRKLAESNIVEKALSTLSGRARIKRTMWSRRAQEYEAKINSGDLVTIAEVVRDLYRSDTQPEQSYSERQLYEAALDRMAREISAVRRLIDAEALKLIESFLQKGPKRGLKSEVDGDGDVDVDGAADLDDADADVDAAA